MVELALGNSPVERDYFHGENLAHLLSCPFEVASVSKIVHPTQGGHKSSRATIDTLTNPAQQGNGPTRGTKGYFRILFGDGYRARSAA